ncbi:hypothetical protein PAL_GLEAN10022687 [Pteropus alecto]|uniref:Uncharacterized protein n=1 Tax=Pteropus alecto TaxID=9402 RepID=L5K7M0_PTEAL|nr:hypothetical protein PAL_GLEAN10022687 [Pteropus alecto]
MVCSEEIFKIYMETRTENKIPKRIRLDEGVYEIIVALNLKMKNVDVILGNGDPSKTSEKGRTELLKFETSVQAPVKAVLEIRDEGHRMQGACATGKLEKLGATEKMLEQPRYNLD